jgi:peroxiredoxin family protein
LFRVFPACSLCIGFSTIAFSNVSGQESQPVALEKRASEKTDMSYTDLFSFSYGRMIPVFQHLSNQIGKEKFIEMLKQATYERSFQSMEARAKNVPERDRDMATFMSTMRNPSEMYKHALSYEILKDTEKEAEFRVTECLWAKTFRQSNAGDIGYALVCHSDIATIKAYNPKIVFSRPKLLMQGDSECRFLYRLEA